MTAVLPRVDRAANASVQDFEIRPFGKLLNAEALGLGLDLRRPISAQDFSRIHSAHLEHHVLVFHDQRITPQQQVDFSRRFGPLQIHVLKGFQFAGTGGSRPQRWNGSP